MEESQKESNFNGKPIIYPGFEPETSGLAVSSHNHCIIWVGMTSMNSYCPFSRIFKFFFNILREISAKSIDI
jgi:hypothetical protein